VLDYWRSLPVVLCSRRLDVLDATAIAQLLSPAFTPGENLATFAFLSDHDGPSRPDWKNSAAATAGLLRVLVDEHDADRVVQRMLGALSTRSREFAELWATPPPTTELSGPISFDLPGGELIRLRYDLLVGAGYDESFMVVFSPVDDSARDAIERLASTSSTDGSSS